MKLAAVFAALAAALGMLRLFDPATSGLFPPCPVRYLTGWYCPGCGSLRAIHQLLEGDFLTALALNPLTVLLSPFLAYGIASYLCFEVRGRHLPRLFLPATSIRVLGFAIVLFGIARNIPLLPFELLKPLGMLRP